MDEKTIFLAIAIVVIVYLVWTRKKETYSCEPSNVVERFTPAPSNVGPSPDGWESFNDYQGDYESAEFDNIDGSVFVETARDAIDPGLQSRQKNFVKELSRGDYNLANPSAVTSSRYQDRESVAITHIGLNAPRRPRINANDKQITEFPMESGFADEDAVLPATVLNPRTLYL